jgi:hypothetical protein
VLRRGAAAAPDISAAQTSMQSRKESGQSASIILRRSTSSHPSLSVLYFNPTCPGRAVCFLDAPIGLWNNGGENLAQSKKSAAHEGLILLNEWGWTASQITKDHTVLDSYSATIYSTCSCLVARCSNSGLCKRVEFRARFLGPPPRARQAEESLPSPLSGSQPPASVFPNSIR